MINACQVCSRSHESHVTPWLVCVRVQDYERQERERSIFLKNHLLQYVDVCVEVDEASALVNTGTPKNADTFGASRTVVIKEACP